MPAPVQQNGIPQSKPTGPAKRKHQKKALRFQKNDAELKEMALRHISYEIKMLRELADALQGKGVGPRTMKNALLESFLIHYRNLYDFFYPDLPAKRRLLYDISAGDYLPSRDRWRKDRPEWDTEKLLDTRYERYRRLGVYEEAGAVRS